ncbi:DUF406 family protein [Shewanella maritima]|uniref:DUF406 family protein n=1 Tax=Shewanella maritima TaxID=2520507 RepID=UPI003735996F
MVNKIIEKQTNVNDTCTDCGSYADIGTVIDEFDTQLEIKSSETKQQLADLLDKAKKRFSNVKSELRAQDNEQVLILVFDVAAEKMIFQLENQL